MRCHSQALTFKLKKDVPVADIEAMIAACGALYQDTLSTLRIGAMRCHSQALTIKLNKDVPPAG